MSDHFSHSCTHYDKKTNSNKETPNLTSLENENRNLSFLLALDQLFFSTQQNPDCLIEVAKFIRQNWHLKGVGIYKEMEFEKLQFQLLAFDVMEESFNSFPLQVNCSEHSALIEKHEQSEDFNISSVQRKLHHNLQCETENSTIIGIPIKHKYEGFIILNYAPNQTVSITDSEREHFKQLFAWKFEQDNRLNTKLEELKKIESLRQRSVEKEFFLNEVLQNSPCGIVQIKNRYIQFVNERFANTVGISASELKNQPISELFTDEYGDSGKILELYNDIEKNGTGKVNLMFKQKMNSSILFQITGIKASEGNNKEYLLLCQDATDVRNIERSLVESEERNKQIMEANIDGVFIINRSGKLTYVNQAGCEMTGFSKSELIDLDLEILFPYTEGVNDYFKIISSIQKEHSYHGDAQLRPKNGNIKHVEIHGTCISLTGKEHYHFSIHDITHRKKAESKLRESEEKFRSLSENLPDCILRIEKEGTITYFNSIASKMFGPKNISLGLIYHRLNFPDTERVIDVFKEVIKNISIKHLEIEHEQTDGRLLTFDWSFSPELDELGQCYSVLAIGRDISIRKQTEKELIFAKEKAETADKVKSIFLANLSHEIRTPLNAIVGFSNLLDKPEFNSLQKKEFTELINKNADRLVWMINEIIDYAKLESGHHIQVENRKMNLLDVLNNIRPIYETKTKIKFGDSVRLFTNIPVREDEAVFVQGDPRKIEQVLTNLLENSLKFVTRGFIELGLSFENEKIKIYVKDSGIGIAPENQSIIFDAFRQEEESPTKTYGGAGLGLAICKLLVESMGGNLRVLSEKNKGAEFYFSLKRTV